MIKELEKLLEKSSTYIKKDFFISSAFSIGKNLDDLKRNWILHLRKGNESVSISFNKIEHSKPLSDKSIKTNLEIYDDKIYKYFEDLMTTLEFNPTNMSISLFDNKIKISFFSRNLNVRIYTLDINGNNLETKTINLISG